jgi:tRNA(Ile)-lysidine synthase
VKDRAPAAVARAIRRERIFTPGEAVLVAVSGGPDSLALLAILRDLIRDFGFRLTVAHFNHGWRDDAEQDARFVEDLAESWGFACIIGHAEAGLPRTEDAARSARYAFLRGTAAKMDSSVIALGHTRDDQVETLVLHLLRGSGAQGLAGMRSRSGDLARPLLSLTRADIETSLEIRGLKPRRDPSNEDPRFTRNRLRQTLMPALRDFDPAAVRLLARAAEILAEEDRFMQDLADRLEPALAENRPAFLALPIALQRRLLRRLNPGLSFAEIERLRLAPEPAPTKAAVARVTARVCRCDPATFAAKDTIGHIDADAVVPPLSVRNRRPGDRIQPLGFGHEKKLQDVLVDAHVPRHLRDSLPLVEDQRSIIWIPGVTVSERHRVSPNTREQLHLEIVRG